MVNAPAEQVASGPIRSVLVIIGAARMRARPPTRAGLVALGRSSANRKNALMRLQLMPYQCMRNACTMQMCCLVARHYTAASAGDLDALLVPSCSQAIPKPGVRYFQRDPSATLSSLALICPALSNQCGVCSHGGGGGAPAGGAAAEQGRAAADTAARAVHQLLGAGPGPGRPHRLQRCAHISGQHPCPCVR